MPSKRHIARSWEEHNILCSLNASQPLLCFPPLSKGVRTTKAGTAAPELLTDLTTWINVNQSFSFSTMASLVNSCPFQLCPLLTHTHRSGLKHATEITWKLKFYYNWTSHFQLWCIVKQCFTANLSKSLYKPPLFLVVLGIESETCARQVLYH